MKLTLPEIQPGTIILRGTKYPAIATHKALILLEGYTGKSYLVTLREFMNRELAAKDFTALLSCLLQGAGVECSPTDLEDITCHEENELVEQIADILNGAIPDGKKKKGKGKPDPK